MSGKVLWILMIALALVVGLYPVIYFYLLTKRLQTNKI